MNNKQDIDEMVRDFCSVVPRSKSDVRERITAALDTAYERGKADAPIEHCAEPNCPACNLAAYQRGRIDEARVHTTQDLNAYRQGHADGLKEAVEKVDLLFAETMMGDGFIGAGEKEWQKIKEFLPIFKEQAVHLIEALSRKE